MGPLGKNSGLKRAHFVAEAPFLEESRKIQSFGEATNQEYWTVVTMERFGWGWKIYGTLPPIIIEVKNGSLQ